MNLWKPLALVSTSALVLVVGLQAASAKTPSEPVPTVGENQPHMRAALVALETAKTQLQAAEHDKGGWRKAAVAATDTAISETKRGIAFDNAH
jgi:hypothetical protein